MSTKTMGFSGTGSGIEGGVAAVVLGAAKMELVYSAKYRRDAVRHFIKRALQLGLYDAGTGRFFAEQELWGCDISMSGIRMLSSRKLGLRSCTWIDLRPIGTPESIMRLRIVRCAKLVEGIYQVGGQFVPPGTV